MCRPPSSTIQTEPCQLALHSLPLSDRGVSVSPPRLQGVTVVLLLTAVVDVFVTIGAHQSLAGGRARLSAFVRPNLFVMLDQRCAMCVCVCPQSSNGHHEWNSAVTAAPIVVDRRHSCSSRPSAILCSVRQVVKSLGRIAFAVADVFVLGLFLVLWYAWQASVPSLLLSCSP